MITSQVSTKVTLILIIVLILRILLQTKSSTPCRIKASPSFCLFLHMLISVTRGLMSISFPGLLMSFTGMHTTVLTGANLDIRH